MMAEGITTTKTVMVEEEPCCSRNYEHVHAPRKENFAKGKVTKNKGVKHVTETKETKDAEDEE